MRRVCAVSMPHAVTQASPATWQGLAATQGLATSTSSTHTHHRLRSCSNMARQSNGLREQGTKYAATYRSGQLIITNVFAVPSTASPTGMAMKAARSTIHASRSAATLKPWTCISAQDMNMSTTPHGGDAAPTSCPPGSNLQVWLQLDPRARHNTIDSRCHRRTRCRRRRDPPCSEQGRAHRASGWR